MQNFQVIVLFVWETANKIYHLIVPLIRNLLLGWAREKIKKYFEQKQTLFKTNLSRMNFP